MSSPRRPRLNSVIVKGASPNEAVSPARGRERRSRSSSKPHRSRSRSTQDSADAPNPGNSLFVGGLPRRVTTPALCKYFSQVGKVVECCLVRDPRTGESRGYGFVTMETAEKAERCIKYLHNSLFHGRVISVKKAKRSRRRSPTKRWRDTDYYSRDRRRSRSRSRYNKRRREDGYSDSYERKRRRIGSLSAGDRRHPR